MPGFHPKLLIFHGNPSFIVVGSANLTWAAQSKNVEANLLVEDPGEELMKDSREFFEHCFSKAPRLTRRHVERYKKRTAKIAVQPPRERSDEDELPLPPRTKAELESIKRGAAVWKIAPGKDADRWHEWFENIDDDGEGIVAMGWNEVGSLDRFETYEDLKEEVVRTAHNKWDKESERKTKVKYVTDQLWTFGPASRSFREGDVFVVYSECKVQGVAVMTRDSKYQFQTLRDISFAHQINVKYRWYKQRPHRADERVIDALGKQGTLMLIEQPEFLPYLLSTLS
jgi:hypothetical protein